MDVGVRLQTIRKPKGLSQHGLAEWAGTTNSTISMIERNSVSPSISSLKRMLGGISMSLVEFPSLDLEQGSHTQAVYKADELIGISSGTALIRLVNKACPSRAIAFLDKTYPPGSDTGEGMLNHEGEEAGVLIDGRLELIIGSETYVLEYGDSYYFESNKPHRFRNPCDMPARLISATTPASF